jgi:hypothetical protein
MGIVSKYCVCCRNLAQEGGNAAQKEQDHQHETNLGNFSGSTVTANSLQHTANVKKQGNSKESPASDHTSKASLTSTGTKLKFVFTLHAPENPAMPFASSMLRGFRSESPILSWATNYVKTNKWSTPALSALRKNYGTEKQSPQDTCAHLNETCSCYPDFPTSSPASFKSTTPAVSALRKNYGTGKQSSRVTCAHLNETCSCYPDFPHI